MWTALSMKTLEPLSDTVQVELGGVQPANIFINGQLEEFDDEERSYTSNYAC